MTSNIQMSVQVRAAEKKTDARRRGRGDRTVIKDPHQLPELVKKNINGIQSSETGRGSVDIC